MIQILHNYPRINRQWRLAERGEAGQMITPEQFYLTESDIPEAGNEEILVRTLCLGTSPALALFGMRAAGKINASVAIIQSAGAGMGGRIHGYTF